MSKALSIFHVDRLDLSFVPKAWAFADERRSEIDAFFAALRRKKPTIWNGRVLLMHRQVVTGGIFRGEYLETDYASFAAWCHWGRPPAKVHDCFSAAAILTADGAFLLGVMGPHTFSAGKIYFPCGTPDPDVERRDNDLTARGLYPRSGLVGGPHLDIDLGLLLFGMKDDLCLAAWHSQTYRVRHAPDQFLPQLVSVEPEPGFQIGYVQANAVHTL